MRTRLAALLTLFASPALAQHPDGASVLRLMGANAGPVFAPSTGTIGALVDLPAGVSAASLGLDPVGPGLGRIRAVPSGVIAFADAHPDLHVEGMPPPHLTMDNASAAVTT